MNRIRAAVVAMVLMGLAVAGAAPAQVLPPGPLDPVIALLLPDTTPDPYRFDDVSNVAPDVALTSNEIVVSGLNTGARLTLSGDASARHSINGGAFAGGEATVANGDRVRLRLQSAATTDTTVAAVLSIGGVSDTWSVRTRSGETGGSGRWFSAYFPCYWRHVMPAQDIDYSALTHIVQWPALPRSDGSLDLSCFENYLDETYSAEVIGLAHAAGTKVLLGVGADQGSGATDGFRGATTDANRATFIANIVNLVVARGYDGVDINWEVIRDEDVANFQDFIVELRAALDAAPAPRRLLTFVPEVRDGARPLMVAAVQDHLDQINLMTYVMSGPYPGWVTWFNSPLFNGGFEFPCCAGLQVPSIDNEVDRFLAAGIPAAKLAISSQFDGFVWSGGNGTATGGVAKPRQRWNDATPPSVTTMRYADIVTQLTPANGYTRHFDDIAQVPWLSRDAALPAQDAFVSYDDAQAIAAKAAYLRAKGLGGYFIFELRGDYTPSASGEDKHPLLKAAKQYVLREFVQTP